MSYKMRDAECPKDLPEITKLLYEAFSNPLQKHFLVYHPVFGSGPDALEQAVDASTRRQINRNAQDTTERWQKVVDVSSNKIVAAALWNIYESNPYEGWEPLDVYWWPAGANREYVNEYFRLHDVPLAELAAKPHHMLKILFTHPDHRGRGLASKLLQHGKELAIQKDRDIWLTSWGLATPFYEHNGFETVRITRVQPSRDEPPSEWLELDSQVQPAVAYTQVLRIHSAARLVAE